MISLQTITGNPLEAQTYLQKGKEIERYYAGTDARPEIEQGIYFGGKALGIDQKIVGDELSKILDGKNLEGQNLYERGRENRRVGFDLTFSPDKSVSLLWARLDEENRFKLETSFRNAVEETLSYTQEHVLSQCVRRGAGGHLKESPQELTWALFQHGSSRERDPQLHMHAILMNFAQRQDGSYGAINEKALFQRQTEIRKVFDFTLASHLQKDLGICMSMGKEGISVDGISRELTLKFSTRRQQIEAAADKYGITTTQAGDNLVLQTRAAKKIEGSDRDLIPEWQKSFDREGFTLEKSQQLLNKHITFELTPERIAERYTHLLSEIGKRQNPLKEHELVSFVAHEFAGTTDLSTLPSLVNSLKEDNRLVKISHEHFPDSYTTLESVEQSQKVFALGKELHARIEHPVERFLMEEILQTYQATGMSEEQVKACQHIVQEGDLSLLVGAAGTGKSYSLRAAREIFEQSGYQVRGLAPTGKASQNLEQSADISSKTVDKFLYDFERNKDFLTPKDIIIVDEAGMIGNEKLKKVFECVQASEAKIILVGDEKQLSSLDSGRPFEVLKETLGAAEINTVRRQNHAWQREAAQDFRQGNVRESLIAYEEHGLLIHQTRFETLKEKLVDDWFTDHIREPTASQLILSSTRDKTKELNTAIRKRLKEENLLSKDCEAKVNITEKNLKGAEKELRAFGKGDRIVFTRNDRKIGVQNGSLGTVENIERTQRGVFQLSVVLDDGKRVNFSTNKYNAIDHGYATTVHKSQGATVDRSYVLAEKMINKEAAYVALTRHREECKVYAATELLHHVSQEHKEDLTTERKVKLHLDKLTQNLEKNVERNKALPLDHEKQDEKLPAVEKAHFVTEAHLQAGQKLLSTERNEVTQALYDIATQPKAVEHRYAKFDFELEDYQKEAAALLKTHDYRPEKLERLKELLESKKIGVEPVLTEKERSPHYFKIKDCVKDRESAFMYNKEMSQIFMTPKQQEYLQILAQPCKVSAQIETLKNLSLTRGSVGLEFHKSADPFVLQRECLAHLESFKPVQVREWAKKVLTEKRPEGCEMKSAHKESYLKKVENAVEKLDERRHLETQREYVTPLHRELAENLRSVRKHSEQLKILQEVVKTPQGTGIFQTEKQGLTRWQENILGLVHEKRGVKFSAQEIISVASEIEKAPLGIEQNGILPNKEAHDFSSKIEIAEKQEKAQEVKRERSHDFGMGM
jgi:Ti-type conjugative transfer relaxase TraA